MITTTITQAKTKKEKPETLRMTLRLADNFWKKHESFENIGIVGENQGPGDGIYFRDATTNTTYTTIKKLGEGGNGIAYTAVAGELTAQQLAVFKADDNARAQFVLKVFKNPRNRKLPDLMERVRHEYDVGKILFRLAPPGELSPCQSIAVCGDRVFIDDIMGISVIGVSEYGGATDLFDFITKKLYPTFSAANAKQYDIEVLRMVDMLVSIFDQLNRIGLFHMDIKSENIVASWEVNSNSPVPHLTGLRIIDFGLSCFMLYENDTGPKRIYADIIRGIPGLSDLLSRTQCKNVSEQGEPLFVYTYNYGNTDPSANSSGTEYVWSKDEAEENFPKFEAYSVVLIILQTLDRAQFVEHKPAFTILNGDVAVVRNTRRSIPALMSALVDLTNQHLEDRPPLHSLGLLARMLINQINISYPLANPPPLQTPSTARVIQLFTRFNLLDTLRRICGQRPPPSADPNMDTVIVYLPSQESLNIALSRPNLSNQDKRNALLYHCVHVTPDQARLIYEQNEAKGEIEVQTLFGNAHLTLNFEELVPPVKPNFTVYEIETVGVGGAAGIPEFVQPPGFECPLTVYRIDRVLSVN